MDDNGVDDDPMPFEVVARGRRLDRAGSTSRDAPDAQAGPDQLPARRRRSRRAAIAITMLAGGGEAPNEGHFRADRGGHAARLDVPSRCARAVLPLRLAGDAGDRGRSTTRVAKAMPERGAGLQRRRHLRARLVGRARGDGRALGRRLAAPGRPGRARRAATARTACCTSPRRRRASRPTEVWEAQEPVADGAVRAGARLRRAPAGTAAGSALDMDFHDARGRRTCTADGRAHQERALGPRGRRLAARPNGGALRLPGRHAHARSAR